MPQNSLHTPSLPEQPNSVTNESCSNRKKQQKKYPTHFHQHRLTSLSLLIKKKASQSIRPHLQSEMVAKLVPLVLLWKGQIAVSVYGGKMSVWKMS